MALVLAVGGVANFFREREKFACCSARMIGACTPMFSVLESGRDCARD